MFNTVVLQVVVPFVFSEYQMLPFEQETLTSILATEINNQIGGKVYENQVLRKGAEYYNIKSYDCPEAVDNEIIFTVQCETSGFFPLCSPDVVYQMKVVEVFPETREMRCEWPDPVTGAVTMLAMVEVESTDMPKLSSLVNVVLTYSQFEYDCDHVKCIGKMIRD